MSLVSQLIQIENQQQTKPVLVVEDSKGKRIINLEKNIYSLGRESKNSIVLHSPLVSRHHATLLRVPSPDNKNYFFQIIDGDLQGNPSTNGLTINGKLCSLQPLQHKDLIRFGGKVQASYLLVNVDLSESEIFEYYEKVEQFNSSNGGIDYFTTLVPSEHQVESINEAVLLRLASFPELIPTPIIEIDLKGEITYLNPAAISQFPDLEKIKLEHPLLKGLILDIKKHKEPFFTREIEIEEAIFEQLVHYIVETKVIRSYLFNITDLKQKEKELQRHRERLQHLVDEQTKSLLETNKQLNIEIKYRLQVEAELRHSEEKFKKLAQREKLLNRLINQIRNSIELDTILGTTVAEIRSLLEVERCNFIWYFSESNYPSLYITHEDCDENLASALGEYPIENPKNPYIEALLKGETVRIDDLKTDKILDPKLRSQLIKLGYTSYLSCPIQISSNRLGIISCGYCNNSRQWTDEQVQLLEAISKELVIELDRSQLYEQSRSTAITAQAQAAHIKQAMQQLQKTQTQLIQSEKMSSLGQMIAGIAHEINNPINFIYGNLTPACEYTSDLLRLLNLYQQYYPQPVAEIKAEIEEIDLEFLAEDLPKLLDSMRVGSERIRQIVLSLRNFSRLDESEMKSVDIHSGIDSTLLILQNRLKAKSNHGEIQVIKEYGDLPLVNCYAGQLNQVFMNLISNAIDALEINPDADPIPEQNGKNGRSLIPTIKIITEVLSNEYVNIRISDNGPGMTEAVKKRLFDPFFTTKPVGKGTGLGLSISYQIVVEKHHGKIHCASKVGQGTEFCIEIPVQQII